jgi:hypothetical protein
MTAANDNEPTEAERLILEAQKLIAATLPPDGSLTDRECIDQLLALLDGPQGQRIAHQHSHGGKLKQGARID